MPSITIAGQTFPVDASFPSLPPAQQQQVVMGLMAGAQGGAAAPVPQGAPVAGPGAGAAASAAPAIPLPPRGAAGPGTVPLPALPSVPLNPAQAALLKSLAYDNKSDNFERNYAAMQSPEMVQRQAMQAYGQSLDGLSPAERTAVANNPALAQQVMGMQFAPKTEIVKVADPNTGVENSVVINTVTKQPLGVLAPDGRILPIGSQQQPSGGGAIPAPPQGVNVPEYRKMAGSRAATEALPSASDELEFANKLTSRQSYKEFSESLPTWNSLQALAAENSPAGDTGLIDGTAKIINPGLAVRQGTYAVYQDEQSGLNRLWGEIQKQMSQGGVLQPDTRAQLMRIAADKMQHYQQAWQTDATQAETVARAHNLDPTRVVPQFPQMNPFDPSGISSQRTTAAGSTRTSGGATGSPGGLRMPAVGEVRRGWRYLGGDPAAPSSWTQQR